MDIFKWIKRLIILIGILLPLTIFAQVPNNEEKPNNEINTDFMDYISFSKNAGVINWGLSSISVINAKDKNGDYKKRIYPNIVSTTISALWTPILYEKEQYIAGIGIYASIGTFSAENSMMKGSICDIGVQLSLFNGFFGIGYGVILYGELNGEDYGVIVSDKAIKDYRVIFSFQPAGWRF